MAPTDADFMTLASKNAMMIFSHLVDHLVLEAVEAMASAMEAGASLELRFSLTTPPVVRLMLVQPGVPDVEPIEVVCFHAAHSQRSLN
jgi:hypothetical protein